MNFFAIFKPCNCQTLWLIELKFHPGYINMFFVHMQNTKALSRHLSGAHKYTTRVIFLFTFLYVLKFDY